MKDKVCNLMLDRIFTRETTQAFLSYCEWSYESEVEVEEFEKNLRDFKNAHPGHAHNVVD